MIATIRISTVPSTQEGLPEIMTGPTPAIRPSSDFQPVKSTQMDGNRVDSESI
jgi:hypothetical protein